MQKLNEKKNEMCKLADNRLQQAAVLGLFIALTMLSPLFSDQVEAAEKFDHYTTGFPLTGEHRSLSCDRCHVGGVFKGTPRQCESCHSLGSRVSAPAKPLNHIPTNQRCDSCQLRAKGFAEAGLSDPLIQRFTH